MNDMESFLLNFSLPALILRKIERKIRGCVSIKKELTPKRWALLSYTTHPFTITKEELEKSPHTNPWECLIIATILLDRGYGVDIIDWTNHIFIPKKKYDLAIDIHDNLERLAPLLPKDCSTVFYATGAHWSYQNNAEKERLHALKERRGCEIPPMRQMTSSRAIEFAQHATALGNSFAKETYGKDGEKMINIPLLSTVSFESPEKKDFAKIKNNFVWIGGGGAVHKGLDIVLEAFAQMPEYHLTICGPITKETKFMSCYKKELNETLNIKHVGRIDVRSELFKNIIENSLGLIYPSCSEGQSGSVITALHAGLIPIVTRQSGVSVEQFGIELKTASVPEVMKSVKTLTELPEEELRTKAIGAWSYARAHHSKETFKNAYASFIDAIINRK